MRDPKRALALLENITFWLALVATGIYLYKTYHSFKYLPPGVCPLESQRSWIYGGIALLITSLTSGYLVKKQGE